MAAEFSVQDIDVEELSITSAVLMGAAHHYGTHCKAKNDAFMQCRMDKRDPRKCLQEGTEVTSCAREFFQKVKGACNESFTAHWTCLDYNNQNYDYCRKTQKPFDDCMKQKMNTKSAET